MGGGGMRSEKVGQPAERMNGRRRREERQRGNQLDERIGGERRVDGVVSRHSRRLLDGEVRRDCSSMAMDGATAPRWQGTAQRLLDGEGWCDGSSTARDGASTAAMDREHNGDGWQWTAQW